MPKGLDINRSQNIIWPSNTGLPTVINKTYSYITFKLTIERRDRSYDQPTGQSVHLAVATTHDTHFSI